MPPLELNKAEELDWTHSKTLRGNSLQRKITEGRMERKRERGRSRQKLMDWMMEDGYGKLKEKAHNNNNRPNNNFRVSNIRVSNRTLIYNVCPEAALT